MIRSGRAAAAIAVGLAAGHAEATWSILVMDTKTGEIALGSATCLTNFDLRANTPAVVAGVGALTAQSFVDGGGLNRSRVIAGLLAGDTPDEILQTLAAEDSGHETRQYGLVSIDGELTFTGTQAGGFAGGLTGMLEGAGPTGGDLRYAIQGNVLTGAPVVEMAEVALVMTGGPLTDRVMAAMEAARDFGGDGRCSCTAQFPEVCGSPPFFFEKTADIGYVLAARPGDADVARQTRVLVDPYHEMFSERGGTGRVRWVGVSGDVSTGVWRTLAGPEPISATSVEQVGVTDPAMFNGFLTSPDTEDVKLLRIDDLGVGGLIFTINDAPLVGEPLVPGVSGPVERADVFLTGDFDGDGIGGLASGADSSIMVAFNFPSTNETVRIEGNPIALAAANDGNGSTLFALTDDQRIIPIRIGADRSLEVLPAVFVEGAEMIAAGDFDGQPGSEAVVFSDGTLNLVRPGTPGEVLPIAPTILGASDILVADANGDGLDDLYFPSRSIGRLLINDPASPGSFTERTIAITQYPAGVFGDFGGDGFAEFLGLLSNGELFTLLTGTPEGPSIRSGMANGDMYLELNIAFAQRQDPDPVDQLREQYDLWRADLAGVTDAVRSDVSLDRASIGAAPGCQTTLTVTLRDLDGQPALGLDASSIRTNAPGFIEAGPFTDLGGGTYEATVSALGGVGTPEIIVTVDDPRAERPVRLTPPATVETVLKADLNGSGTLEPVDFQAWLDAFNAGDLAADQNADGLLTGADFNAWIQNYTDPCL